MSQDDDTSSYNNTHRAFLQALLARQTLTIEAAKPLLAAIETAASNSDRSIPSEDITQEDLDNYVDTLNAHISAFDFEIRYTLHQTSKERIYALVNTTSDALTQMATVHSADEITFVKRVLDAMFETNNTPRAEVMAVTGMQALKLAKAPGQDSQGRRQSGTQAQGQSQAVNASLTMSQAEKVLENMVAEGWFELSQRGFYSLTPRTLMELRGWLQDTYNVDPEERDEDDEEDEEEPHQKVKLCHACRDIHTVGQRCPNLVCQARVHNHCVRNMFRAQGGAEQCPVCETRWADAPPVGEKAAKSGGRSSGRESQVNGRASNGAGSARRRADAMEVESEDNYAEGGASD